MNKVNIKPLTVNQCWKGRRFKTDKYKKYERDLLYILPRIKIPEGLLQINLEFGFSSDASDWDNPIKPIVDILQKKYGFNDKRIKRGVVDIKQVKEGSEYIKFELLGL